MSTAINRFDTPAGTREVRAGGNFTRINRYGADPDPLDTALRVLVDGRYIADVFEAVPGSWSTTGIAGYQTGFASAAATEDAVIAAYHQLPVRADYEVDVLDDGDWRTVLTGRVGVDADRLPALGVKAREIAAAHQTLRNPAVRVTLWSTTAPSSRVTTYAEYSQEEPMSEQPGQGQGQGQTDPLTADPLTPAAEAVSPDWSTLGQADRVWRVNPATGQPQGLTIDAVNEDTVTGQLDFGPTVTLPLTDIEGRVFIVEEEVAKVLGVGGKSNVVDQLLARLATDPNTIVWSVDLKGDDQTRVWAAGRTSEREAAVRRALADPDAPRPGTLQWASDEQRRLAEWFEKATPEQRENARRWLMEPQSMMVRPRRSGDDLPWPDPDARPRW